jgi:hypothetical protein
MRWLDEPGSGHARDLGQYGERREGRADDCDAADAQATANLYSLVMTCRANEVEPYAYLNYMFEYLPAASTVAQVEALLHWNVKAVLDEQNKSQERSQPAAARRGGPLLRHRAKHRYGVNRTLWALGAIR